MVIFSHEYEYNKEKQKLKEKLYIAITAMELARDTAYSSTQDCQNALLLMKNYPKP